jgi:UDP-N-acetylglucosamine:LPS N-acetylglucosamine transferase
LKSARTIAWNWLLAIMPLPADKGAALAAADVVVSRAGASSWVNFAFALPAILVPYHASLSKVVELSHPGRAIMLQDNRLDDELLVALTSCWKRTS